METTLKAGDAYTFGKYAGEPIEWVVLEASDDKALLLSVKGLECKKYHEVWAEMTWEKCSLRAWLNDDFLCGFTVEERARFVQTSVVNVDSAKFGTPGGPDTLDYAFCLSVDEAQRYFATDEERVCYPTERAVQNGARTSSSGACFWWLRSPGSGADNAASVRGLGNIQTVGADVDRAGGTVRPAMWISL